MDLRDAQTVLAQLPAAFEHFNEVHPHSSLKMRSPREFRRQQAAGANQALYCEWGGVGNTGARSDATAGCRLEGPFLRAATDLCRPGAVGR